MAGIVLTVGMAVDANVLIFERIREEIRAGRSVQQAIHHGYESAFSTIFDANITTLIAAVILFSFGAGPIKGFAITLSIGIITSVFTAVVVTRAIVNLWVGGKRVEKLSI
jgi:preprotein translocase subunit SecD